MKILFLGGTGIISSACARLAQEEGHAVTLLTRGQSLRPIPSGAHTIRGDVQNPASLQTALEGLHFDVVADFVAFTPEDVARRHEILRGKTGQYVFISSASAYQTPPATLPVRESTILDNPVWQYSRNKIAGEEYLVRAYREEKFPMTIVRPSHTYDETYLPIPGGWTVAKRMLNGQPVIVHGDGTSLWTLTHNSDFARGFVGLLGNSHAIGEVFHITSDEWLSWNQIHQLTAQALGVEAKLVHIPSDLIAAYDRTWGDSLLGDKSHSFILDNSKIKQVVPGFKCMVPFSVGIRRVIAWYRADPTRQAVDPIFEGIYERILSAYQKAWPDGQIPF